MSTTVPAFMAARLERLKARADFVRVANARRTAAGPGLVVQAAAQPVGCRPDGVRVGFTASRKVGNSVTRNRAKRRLRAIAASILPIRGKPGTDYVLIARASTADRPFAALVADLEAALRRIEFGRADGRSGATPRPGRS